MDWTDHVWTEVYIDEFKRWVHMDSCENSFDQPLLYEKGWGKKLTYVISISSSEVVDTTHRYVLDKTMTRMRRDKVNEEWLKSHLKKTREQMWDTLGPDRKQICEQRFLAELKEFEKDQTNAKDTLLPR